MSLFGLPDGLMGGSKETEYLTLDPASRLTAGTTSFSTNRATNDTTNYSTLVPYVNGYTLATVSPYLGSRSAFIVDPQYSPTLSGQTLYRATFTFWTCDNGSGNRDHTYTAYIRTTNINQSTDDNCETNVGNIVIRVNWSGSSPTINYAGSLFNAPASQSVLSYNAALSYSSRNTSKTTSFNTYYNTSSATDKTTNYMSAFNTSHITYG